jgi:hypothetical protein
MSENQPGARRQYRARKTPASPYPPAPPKIPESVESLYHAVNQQVLDSATIPFREFIVTSQILYKPGILAAARVTFEGTRWEIYHERDVFRVIPFPGQAQIVDWEQNLVEKWDPSHIKSGPEGLCFYVVEQGFDFSSENFEALQEQFSDYLLANQTLELVYNPHLRIYRKLDEDESMFYQRCMEKVREDYDQEKRTLEDTILRQEERLKEKLERELREQEINVADFQSYRTVDANTTSSHQLTPSKNQAEMNTRESMVNIEDIQQQLAIIQREKEAKINEFEENLEMLARQQERDLIRVNRGNIKISRFSLIWLPYTEFIVQEDDRRRVELVRSF